MAPAASRPATTDGTTPVASMTTIATSTTTASLAPSPSGMTWRRTCSGESTTRTLRSSRVSSSADQVPRSSRTSPTARVVSPGPSSSPLRWIARITQVAAVGDHPGEDRVAHELGSRRDHDLGDARSRG